MLPFASGNGPLGLVPTYLKCTGQSQGFLTYDISKSSCRLPGHSIEDHFSAALHAGLPQGQYLVQIKQRAKLCGNKHCMLDMNPNIDNNSLLVIMESGTVQFSALH